MNKLKGGCFFSHDTSILLYEIAREYTNIPSCSGKLIFDSSLLQEGIFVYTLVKMYNKANLYIYSVLISHIRNHICQLRYLIYGIRHLISYIRCILPKGSFLHSTMNS